MIEIVIAALRYYKFNQAPRPYRSGTTPYQFALIKSRDSFIDQYELLLR
jgi:hypothetical protein